MRRQKLIDENYIETALSYGETLSYQGREEKICENQRLNLPISLYIGCHMGHFFLDRHCLSTCNL